MFAKYVDHMHTTCSLLSQNPESGTVLGRLVCSGLNVVATQAKTYDAAVSSEFAFKKHFFGLLTSLHKMEDGVVFQLFEDIALFVRSRSLKFGADSLSQAEKDILHHFETSDQWQRDSRALVTESYWYELPERIRAE